MEAKSPLSPTREEGAYSQSPRERSGSPISPRRDDSSKEANGGKLKSSPKHRELRDDDEDEVRPELRACKLEKGPNFPSPEEIFDDPSDVELFNSLVGSDGWCIHFEKTTRKCSIYADRPYFCRVEPAIFETLYGIEKKKSNKEACSCCIDTIKAIPNFGIILFLLLDVIAKGILSGDESFWLEFFLPISICSLLQWLRQIDESIHSCHFI
ncbi:hypothetical protein HAX54_048982 [Datura stramonium]|uniref:Uncharacterized protein n=1 Tax=Datura stramonium TaxID=4076 RepID=A0ABS8WJZ2_DATST|nr:hypothetical protein [Datura stramonium]